ncbi:choline/ethanolamine kinase, partial [Thraustotheca clavata]
MALLRTILPRCGKAIRYKSALAAIEQQNFLVLPPFDQKELLCKNVTTALKSTVPGWENTPSSQVKVEHLSGAMTNVIFTCSKPTPINEKVLLRVYGSGTDAFFCRNEEMAVFQELSRNQFGVRLLGEFDNGRVESMIDGRTCTAADIRNPILSQKIAIKFRQFHNVHVDIDRNPRILNNINKLFNDAKHKCAKANISVDFTAFANDISTLTNLLRTVPSPIVFCHNDLQYGNIMLSSKTNDVVFIDFEYSHYNPRGYDLGNHFSEWCYDYHGETPEFGDFTKYPSVEEQRAFCRAYLSADGNINDEAVESLCREANAYALATHLFWSLWGFIQATQSSIEFDFYSYATCRWGAFHSQ